METLELIHQRVTGWLDIPIFQLGDSHITLWTFFYLLVWLLLLFWAAGWLRRVAERRVLTLSKLDLSGRQAAGTVFQYMVIALGMLVILQTAGIDLTTLNILAGAVGIGVGFGLQNIANNFISGLIILFERPIKLGDRIVVGDIEGDVTSIGSRSTTVLTNDNISIIVPNSRFISESVINWSHSGETIRFRIPVSVAYSTDTRLVEKVLLEVAQENSDVLDSPAPAVRLVEFGDSGLQFELRAWTGALLHRKGLLVSALNFAILDKFREHKIEIPFPQRDVHIKSGPPSNSGAGK